MQSALVFPAAVIATVEAGPFISLGKIVPVLVVLLLWSRLLTWADKDTDRAQSQKGLYKPAASNWACNN